MSRTRALIAIAAVLAFAVAAGVLIYTSTQKKGGRDVVLDVEVTGASTMSPSDLKATHNDKVTINVRSDQEGEVHLHVYDIAVEVKPGEVASRTFTADRTCRCEIEWEETGAPLGTLTVSP